jgi:ATP-dependent helicase STH1/SNF2
VAVRTKAFQLARVQQRVRRVVRREHAGELDELAQRLRCAAPPAAAPESSNSQQLWGNDEHCGVALSRKLAAAMSVRGMRRAACAVALRSRNAGVLSVHKALVAAVEERRARAAVDRLAALKANDFGSYLKLVRSETTKRISSLLSRTDAYLATMERKIAALRSGGGAGGATGSSSHDVAAPDALKATLRPYQLAGLRWLVRALASMRHALPLVLGPWLSADRLPLPRPQTALYHNGLNGCLADEMGLGKTVQVIALLCHLVQHEGLARGPFLVVVPASVLPNWASELSRWAPSLRVATYAGAEPVRASVYAQQIARGGCQVVLTTFEFMMNVKDVPRLSRIKWAYLVMDEVRPALLLALALLAPMTHACPALCRLQAHRIKNASCRLTRELEKYRFGRRLLLTGTPVQNKCVAAADPCRNMRRAAPSELHLCCCRTAWGRCTP